MTTAALERLADPEFRKWLVENISEEDRNKYGAFLKRELEAAKYNWKLHARPEQLPPDGDWIIWLLVTGRRWGKTRSAAEWLRKRALGEVGSYAICAPTYGDVRDVCVEGGQSEPMNRRSGFISVCAPGEIENYNRSIGEIRMSNGSKIKMLSADEPDRARGWGFNAAWCDEFSSWRYPSTWYETLLPAVTMSDTHRFIITTTPKPNELTKALMARVGEDDSIVCTRGRTLDNQGNLGAGAVAELRRQMTERQARQELEGELLLDVPGALATLDQLDAGRVKEHPELVRVVVGVDPAVTNTAESDETGIQVMGKGIDGHIYHLADRSCRTSVDDWTRRVVKAAVEFNAGKIKYEKNQGHDAIGLLIQRAMDDMGVTGIKVEDVNASKSKFDRALGLQQSIERGVYHLVGSFPELEEQYTTWTVIHGSSPDRLDGAVHTHNDLMEEDKKPRLRFYG